MLIPLLILIVWMGMYSNHFLRPMDASVTQADSSQTQNGTSVRIRAEAHNPK